MSINSQSAIFTTQNYLNDISRYFQDENSSEMSYRTPFQHWLEQIFTKEAGFLIQHDQRSINGNKPDFIVSKNQVPILYIEVKKVGEDLDKIVKSSQASRYFGYANLIITDYLEFRFFRNGKPYDEPLVLGTSDKQTRIISPSIDHAERLFRTINDFTFSQKEPIRSGKHLAKIMGGRAQRIRDNVIDFLKTPTPGNDSLFKIMQVIKENLLADITLESFADMYAQTLVYGLFAARYADSTLDNFSRQEARDLIPASNPFLQHFFDHIAGSNFPKRLDIIVTELCEVFTYADVHHLLSEYYTLGDKKSVKDPVVHFYEDFLLEYDPAKKVEMGVFYTPLPVVRFILRSVDTILKTKFDISQGLADPQKIMAQKMAQNAKGKMVSKKAEYHRVQILDFATGTGTFLNETIMLIFQSFAGQTGRWPAYVQSDLLPRIHGFELMVASYTIAHIKLGLALRETGVEKLNNRLGIYLTNSLDAPTDHTQQGTLFGLMESIADESYSASRVKKEYPIMVVVGNPPYSGISQNKQFTDNSVYKVEPGGKEKLQERKNWLDDDYVKFIRLAESLVEKNQEGIIGLITAHGFIDNPTFRGMRWHLRETFDEIYVLDLHGNSNKKETSPDGSKDENIFDIKTGVSIILGIRRKQKTSRKPPATVYKYDLFGLRESKFNFLNDHDFKNIDWKQLPKETEIWKKTGIGEAEYQKGFSVSELFHISSTGIVTARDGVVIDQSKDDLLKRIERFCNPSLSDEDVRNWLFPGKKDGKYLSGDSRGWKLAEARKIIRDEDHGKNIIPIAYRPLDTRWIYYHPKMVDWGRQNIMSHFLDGKNVGLVVCRQTITNEWNHVNVTALITDDSYVSNRSRERGYVLPLYIDSPIGGKTPNLNQSLWGKINSTVGDTQPEDILDYIYGYLHSPSYRAKFAEFLKTDFPRIPFPLTKQQFWNLVPFGRTLRSLHLMTDPRLSEHITTYLITGDDTIKVLKYSDQKVFINETQFFGQVSEIAWNFFIGGYQPAQKWLKDRKGKQLNNVDLDHYQKIVTVLSKTSEIMQKIDEILQ